MWARSFFIPCLLPQGYSHEGGERQLCDWCNTTIGNRYRTCVRCGFETCLQCAALWKAQGRPPAVERHCAHALGEALVFAKVPP